MNASTRTPGFNAVRTTGIFCLPSCPARPKAENVERMATVGAALVAGYRPCQRCFPLHEAGRAPVRSQRAVAPVVRLTVIDTPLGHMIAAATAEQLVLLEFADRRMLHSQFKRLGRLLGCTFELGGNAVLSAAREQLEEFFAGRRRQFDLPLLTPGTPFQRRVWSELTRIPAGATRSYAEQARAIGQPDAVRAVARANGDNRIAIVIPCHRVIGSDGSLTGYGGGLWRKQRLLEREAAPA